MLLGVSSGSEGVSVKGFLCCAPRYPWARTSSVECKLTDWVRQLVREHSRHCLIVRSSHALWRSWDQNLIWADYKLCDCLMAHALAACCCCQATNRSLAIDRSCCTSLELSISLENFSISNFCPRVKAIGSMRAFGLVDRSYPRCF